MNHDSNTRAVLSQGEPRDAAVNFDTHTNMMMMMMMNLTTAERHRAVSLPQHGFLV